MTRFLCCYIIYPNNRGAPRLFRGKAMKIAFLGHAFIPAEKEVKEEVKEQIRNNLLYDKFITCYLGGYGDFDRICACACRELKGEGVALEMVFVSPYISLSQQ